MRVFEGRFRIAMPKEPCDRKDGFALPQGDAGMGMAKIVKPSVAQVRLGADPRPEMVQPASTLRSWRPGRREDPSVDSLESVEDVPCRPGKPDGSGTRLAVAEEETAFAVVGPAQAQISRPSGIRSGEEGGPPRPVAAAGRHGRTALRPGGGSRHRTESVRVPLRR